MTTYRTIRPKQSDRVSMLSVKIPLELAYPTGAKIEEIGTWELRIVSTDGTVQIFHRGVNDDDMTMNVETGEFVIID